MTTLHYSCSHSTLSGVRLCFQRWTICTKKKKSVFLFGQQTQHMIPPEPVAVVTHVESEPDQQLLTNSPVGNKTIAQLFVHWTPMRLNVCCITNEKTRAFSHQFQKSINIVSNSPQICQCLQTSIKDFNTESNTARANSLDCDMHKESCVVIAGWVIFPRKH